MSKEFDKFHSDVDQPNSWRQALDEARNEDEYFRSAVLCGLLAAGEFSVGQFPKWNMR